MQRHQVSSSDLAGESQRLYPHHHPSLWPSPDRIFFQHGMFWPRLPTKNVRLRRTPSQVMSPLQHYPFPESTSC